jgi:flagellar M-ring protein FliF
MVGAGEHSKATGRRPRVDSLRQLLANISTQVGKMKASQKLLLLFVVVVLMLVLFIVRQTSGNPTLVEVLPGATPAENQSASAHLAGLGFKTQLEGGKLLVAPADRPQAVAALAEAQMLPNNKEIIFRNILTQQNWTNTKQQNDTLYNEALQNELALTISKFSGVKNAKVFIDAPAPMGLGQNVRRPTASVSVVTRTGEPMPQATVDAIANLVSGSKAGLSISTVRVIDASTGRQRRPTSEDEMLSSTYYEHASRVESQVREKVQDLLSSIGGVVVAVTAQVDVTKVTSTTLAHLPEKQGTVALRARESETVTDTKAGSAGGAVPGVEANQTADITRLGGGPGANSANSTTTTTEYENHAGTRSETVIDPRGYPTRVAISVNVPRNFIVRVLQAGQKEGSDGGTGDAKQEPSEDQIRQAFEQRVKPWITDLLTPQITAMMQLDKALKPEDRKKEQDAIIAQTLGVSLMPIDLPENQSAGLFGGLASAGGGRGGSSGGGAGMLGIAGDLFDRGVLVLLSVIAMGMMFVMVRKSTKKMETPTAEELVGLPPQLENAADVVGEAGEGETAMTGIEVEDDTMQSQKMLEQVSQMVDQSPETVARLVQRWIRSED